MKKEHIIALALSGFLATGTAAAVGGVMGIHSVNDNIDAIVEKYDIESELAEIKIQLIQQVVESYECGEITLEEMDETIAEINAITPESVIDYSGKFQEVFSGKVSEECKEEYNSQRSKLLASCLSIVAAVPLFGGAKVSFDLLKEEKKKKRLEEISGGNQPMNE